MPLSDLLNVLRSPVVLTFNHTNCPKNFLFDFENRTNIPESQGAGFMTGCDQYTGVRDSLFKFLFVCNRVSSISRVREMFAVTAEGKSCPVIQLNESTALLPIMPPKAPMPSPPPPVGGYVPPIPPFLPVFPASSGESPPSSSPVLLLPPPILSPSHFPPVITVPSPPNPPSLPQDNVSRLSTGANETAMGAGIGGTAAALVLILAVMSPSVRKFIGNFAKSLRAKVNPMMVDVQAIEMSLSSTRNAQISTQGAPASAAAAVSEQGTSTHDVTELLPQPEVSKTGSADIEMARI